MDFYAMTTDTDEITRENIEGRIERSIELREAIKLAQRMRSQEKIRPGQTTRRPVYISRAPIIEPRRWPAIMHWLRMIAIIAAVMACAFLLTVWALVTAQAWGIL